MTANETQVGGTHYKTSYEHWDLVLRTGMDYLAGNATKYIARNRKKGGVEDLKKALHYIEKLEEYSLLVGRSLTRPSLAWIRYEVKEFCAVNDLDRFEGYLVMMLATWTAAVDLRMAGSALDRHIKDLPVVEPAPVPASDSNKHADRAPEYNGGDTPPI